MVTPNKAYCIVSNRYNQFQHHFVQVKAIIPTIEITNSLSILPALQSNKYIFSTSAKVLNWVVIPMKILICLQTVFQGFVP